MKYESVDQKEEKLLDYSAGGSTSNHCPICNRSMNGSSSFQQSIHYLKHFRRDLETHVRRHFPGNNRACGHCYKKCEDEQTLFVHLGTEHGFFKKFIEDFKNKKITVRNDSYSTEFDKFLEMSSNKSSLSNQKASVRQVQSGEQCKLCSKVFEEFDKDGVKKPATKVAEKRFNHYVSHFRQDLIDRHPTTFINAVPLYCDKCDFNTSYLKKSKTDHNREMISHVAKCKQELEKMIEAAKPKKTAAVSPKPTGKN